MRRYYKAYKKVGKIHEELADILGFQFKGSVYISPGVVSHVKRRHGKQLTKNVKENLLCIIEKIIEEPDFIGIDKRRSLMGALEFIKKVDNNILVGLEVDLDEGYIYVATLYPITQGKIEGKLCSGRLIKYNEIKKEINKKI